MSDKPSTQYNLETITAAMTSFGVSVNEAAVSFARMAGKEAMITPDDEVCFVVDAIDAIPVSDSDLRDVYYG